MIVLDDWQKEILEYRGDIALCKGRRIGGTEIFSIKAAERMISDPGVEIVFISLTEDQAKICISVALEHLTKFHKSMIGTGKLKPQLGKIFTKNKSSFMVRPVGNTGNAVRGFNGDILGIDEAPWQPDMMWTAARPILSTNDGELWMWGTPAEKKGYFWEQYNKAYNLKDPKARFKVWHKDSETVLFNRPISEGWSQKQRDGAIRILGEEKKDMSAKQYGNEYLGLFLEECSRFFDDEVINKACVLKAPETIILTGKNSMGNDIARMGNDEGTYEIINDDGTRILKHVYHEISKKQDTVATERRIIDLTELWKCRKVGIDAGAGTLGVSVLDHLLDSKIRSKVLPINNRQIVLDSNDNGHQRILKIDLYNNLLSMIQHGEIQLLDNDEVRRSLASIQFDFPKDERGLSKMRIWGNYSHVVEGLIRAAWLAKKEKSLNLYCY
jgi:hypothetical protein